MIWGLGVLCLLGVVLFGRDWVVLVSNQQARMHLSAGEYDQARQWLERSDAWRPDQPQTVFLWARLHRKLGQAELFFRQLARAEQLGADAESCRREQWLADAQAGQLRTSEGRLAGLLEDARGDAAEICEAFANGYMLNGRFAEAMKLLDSWETAYPHQAQPHYMQGLIRKHLGDYPAAEESLRAALALAPDHPPSLLALADLLSERKRHEEALALYQLASGHPRLRTEALVGVARCHRGLGQSERANAALREVLEQRPEQVDSLLELSQLELAAGDLEEAERFARRAYEVRPQGMQVRYQLASVLSAAGQEQEARQHYDYAEQGRKALHEARDEIIRVNDRPQDAASRVRIGKTLLQYENEADGLMWLRAALQIDPRLAEAHQVLADYFGGPGAGDERAQSLARFHRQQAVLLRQSSSTGESAAESKGESAANAAVASGGSTQPPAP